MFQYLIPLHCQDKITDFSRAPELFRCPSFSPLQHLRQIIIKWKRDAFSRIFLSKMSLKYDIASGQAGNPVITAIRKQVWGLFALFSAESSPIPYWILNTAPVHFSWVSLCGHFSHPPTDWFFCMFHETIWTHLLVLPVSPAQRCVTLSFTTVINLIPSAIAKTPFTVRAWHI